MKTKLLVLLLLASQLTASAAPGKSADYVAHEWGTFTSLQGADGVQLEWRPSIGVDLPAFVYNYLKPESNDLGMMSGSLFAKAMQNAKQRMETPVIYFYSDDDLKVDVQVDFPEGIHTEWYPRVSAMGPSFGGITNNPGKQPNPISKSFIRWDNVQIIGNDASGRNAANESLLNGGEKSHYYAARETDANLIRFDSNKPDDSKIETDRFLFYRGVGRFQAPLLTTVASNERTIYLRNTSSEALRHLFLLEARDGRADFQYLANLEPRKSANFKRDPNAKRRPLDEFTSDVFERLSASLAEAGLYPAEARAMVKTWQDSWFEEDGLRVLYVLGDKWTDQTLPLQLSPAPKEVKRVMVGRAEIILPSTEWSIMKSIVHFSDGDAAARTQAVEDLKALRLGRFLDPIMARATQWNPNATFRAQAAELVKATKPANPIPVKTAQSVDYVSWLPNGPQFAK